MMKKRLGTVLALALTLVLGLTACGGQAGNGGSGDGGSKSESETKAVDFSGYPESIDEWSGQDFIDYFTEAGVFKDGGGYETWLQNHTDYWPGTPVDECAGWWDVDGEGVVNVMIFIFGADNADTSEEDMNEWLDYIKENKSLTEEYGNLPIDHLVGNVAFCIDSGVFDDDILAEVDAAYQTLIQEMGATPEF